MPTIQSVTAHHTASGPTGLHAPSSSSGAGTAPRPGAAGRGLINGTLDNEGTLHEIKAVAIAFLVTLTAVAVWAGALVVGVWLSVWLTPRPLPPGHPAVVALPAGPMIDPELALHGRDLYVTSCAICHAADGSGRSGLGVTLARSDYVARRADDEVVKFIVDGRLANDPRNTTGLPMPPRGGQDALTDADIRAIVAYVRGIQDPRRMATLAEYTPPAPSAADAAATLAAAGGDPELAEWIASGTRLFASNCLACHGANGIGITGVGMPLRNNAFIQSHDDDDDLLDFLLVGRMPGDPESKLGLAMPAKGGNPALDEDDLLDIVAYLRTLQNLADWADRSDRADSPDWSTWPNWPDWVGREARPDHRRHPPRHRRTPCAPSVPL